MATLSDRGPTVFVVTLVLIVVATVFVVLRLISKWGVTRKANADDYVIIVAWLIAVGLSVSIMIGTRVGLGAPDADIKPQWYLPLKQSVYAFTVLYNPAIMTTKTAILILYYRMAATYPFLRYASLFTIAVINIAGVVLTFLYIFQCRPVTAAFSLTDGTCIDIVALYLSSMPINVLTDLAILLLPLPILTSLRMEFRQKVILVTTFIVGGFVTIVDVVRIVYLQVALKEELAVNPGASITATSRPPNFIYQASFSLMWSAVEVSVGIMCCCVLVLKPLVMRVMPKLLHSPSLQRHRPSGTPDSIFNSDASKSPRPLDCNHLENVPSSPRMSLPAVSSPSSRTPDPNRTESPISPLSPRLPRLSVVGEQTTAEESEDGEDTMGFFEMLASEPLANTPGTWHTTEVQPTANGPSLRRPTVVADPRRRSTGQTDTSQGPSQNFFDFVQVKGRVSLTQLSARDAWWPTLFVSTLFFLWGFAYGLIGSLNVQIQVLLGYPPSRTMALHAAAGLGYFLGPLLLGYWILKYQSFQATFMTGLAIFATGSLAFWPSSILRSYPGFFISNFIIFFGLAVLELAADTFVALAGPGELSEARLNFAQAFNGIGSIVSPIIAQEALFSGINEEDLFRVQWCYFATALFVVLLAVVFYYVPLSEASDDELEAMALQRLYNAGLERGVKVFGVSARLLLLWSGVAMMWLYIGCQDTVAYFWSPLVQFAKPGFGSFWSLSVARSVFTASRFLTAGLCYVGVPPRITLGVCFLGACVTSIVALVLPPGGAGLAMLLLYYFFEGPMVPTLYAMVLRGQGRHTKFAASAIVSSISGSAVWPAIVYGIENLHPTSGRPPLLVVAILFGISTLWPIMLSSRRVLRRWVDPKWSKRRVNGPGEGTQLAFESLHEKGAPVVAHHERVGTEAHP